MKKYLPYLLGIIILSGIIVLFATGQKKKTKKIDERITMRKEDKIPYGDHIAYRCLPYLFPDAKISSSQEEPGFWDSLSNNDEDQAYIVVTDHFNADENEMRRILNFVENGNDVFVSAKSISDDAADIIGCSIGDLTAPRITEDEDGRLIAKDDSLSINLNRKYFPTDSVFEYPGRRFSSTFTKVNEDVTNELGDGQKRYTNFIHLKSGKGNLYLHLAPLAFSNYFLLHKNNIQYYQMVMSVISPDVTKVVWDEYFIKKGQRRRQDDTKSKDWFTVLTNMKNADGKKPFKASFWVAILLLLLYVLFEMRRKQRAIPVVTKPRNDSLEFVKTIGRLYYDKADHKNLSRKMAAYFLEHVRSNYKLSTNKLDEDFIKALKYKSGAEEFEIRGIVSYIKYLEDVPAVNHIHVTEFYKQLEAFYQKA